MAGWQTKKIGEVFRIVNGGTPKTGVASYWGGSHLWITPAEMGGLDSPFISESRRSLSDDGLRVGAELIPENSLILSTRAPIGHLVINAVPMAFNQGCKGLVPPSKEVETKFAYYYLLANVPLLESLGTGATFKELSSGKLKEVLFCYPTIEEQRRIVAILDEAFEGIATAKANAEKNQQNARELLAVSTSQTFAALGEDHKSRFLGSVCRFENGDRGKNYPGKEHRVKQGIPFVNAGHLTVEGIDFAEMDYISPDRFDLLGNGKIQPKDILFCLRGSLGKFASVGDLSCGAIASSLVILRPTSDLDHGYLLCFLGSPLCSEQIEAYKGGAAQPNLGAKDLKEFELPLPPFEVQQIISGRITELKERVFELLNITNKKLAALDELKKSLLHQAFSGRL